MMTSLAVYARLAPLTLVGALVGCSTLSYTVDRDLLEALTIENKLALFDAENDVSIAMDEMDQIQREIKNLRYDLEDAGKQVSEAESDAERADAKSDANGAKVAQMAAEVFELKRDLLAAQIDLEKERLEVQQGFVVVSLAKYELAKAKLVKKNNVRGAADIELDAFEKQVDACVLAARDRKKDFGEEEKAVEALRQNWLARRAELSKLSGGGVGSAWAEDSGFWGN